ncbi:ATP-binding protein [Halorubrum ezzemoulense]|uniref:histidine kinase n=2 Tax=Halorubrum ezzemoulense TaxID=337243 RepID=A0A256JE18_HALEZ|nr:MULTISPECIES: ATP-binding protein [Halorubrum]MDB2238766.1 ATP-binding protein [Halorubrum ezzemoulense]MDB2246353.1 ATP-binding protein [Halorubrum ezzemoulense]MDB2249423.1 ATP-binding protein [Halorubrum ezzemoulense]MDB2253144.1 ATP-binding protein [Halorubrum ezzemoulense]MDB2262244.1 ATP-binding protein [Halorubrum ezzemoulense]
MLLSLGPSLAVDLVAVGLLAWVTWQTAKDRSPPNAVPFALMSGSLLLWALLSLISEFPNAWGVGSNLAAIAQVVPVVFLPAIWLVYVLGYIGRETGFTSLRGGLFVLLALPLIGAAATFEGDPTREEIRRSLASLVGTELLLLFIIYAYAAFLFLRYGWNHGRVSRTQVGIQLGAISAPYIIGGWLDGSLIIDGVTGGLLVSGVLLTVAIQRYPVLTGFPKADYVARSRVVESLQEAVVVVDWEANILDANVTAEGLFGWATRDVIGTPVSAAVDGFDVTNLSAGTTEVVSLQTTKGRRQFQYTVSDVERDTSDSDGEPVARTIVFRDVTDQRTREQRLSVLNRVLRHNARNKLDVILAHADHVEDDTHRTAIQNSASELASVSRKAREAEAVMTDSVSAPSTVDIAAVAHEVAATARDDYPDSSISVTAPERLQLTSYRTVVRRLMTELVENAIVHSDDPARVDIEVETTADDIPQLRIADNGPGIPDRERDLLTESSETQLEHGLGVGLWFVNWAVSQLGAELEFQSTGTTGTTVVVRFYRNRESMPQDSDGSHNR